jgi:sugar phosphate isomerase/epimerase
MIAHKLSRRSALARTGLLAGAAAAGGKMFGAETPAPAKQKADVPFRFCLNMATIRGQKLGIARQIEVAAQAGYDAIEPWMDSIEDYVSQGGKLAELRRRIADSGLTVASAIAFPEWMVEDEQRRAKGLERARQLMDSIAQMGGSRMAAPPAGATELPKIEVLRAAERYRALLEAGQQLGVTPQFELWGFSHNFNRLGECVWVAMETGHPKACVLADVFHLYKGGSGFSGLQVLGPRAIQVLHMNDFPSDPPREKIDDSYRVYPGDGTAPLAELLRGLHDTGGQKVLSLELFNRKYWAEDALAVARTGLAKMKAVAEKALLL